MTREETASPQAIAAPIGLDLPPGAQIDHAERISGQDDAVRLVVRLPEAAWRTLVERLASKAGEAPVFSADQNFHLGPPGEGWRPGDAMGLKTAQLPWAGGAEALNLGLAPAGRGEVRLFVFWHQL